MFYRASRDVLTPSCSKDFFIFFDIWSLDLLLAESSSATEEIVFSLSSCIECVLRIDLDFYFDSLLFGLHGLSNPDAFDLRFYFNANRRLESESIVFKFLLDIFSFDLSS